MFKPNELERFSMIFEPQMKAAEERIMADVIRRLKINGEITRAADWQIHRAYELGLSKRKVAKIIQEEMGITYKQVKTMYRQVMQLGYSRDEKLYKYKGIAQVPFEKNEGLQQLISAVAEQTYENMQNITQSLGFAVRNEAGKLIFSPLADYYQQTLDAAMLDISSGAFDYNTVLKRVVRELTNSGLRTIDYATGWKNRVDVASRRAVMTGMSQLTAKVNEDNAEQLGTDQFEIEWHGGARPEHWWGGMVMSKKELRTKCGLGTVTGLCGVNCYHDYYPFIPGISERSYTDEELEELNRKENTPVEYGGKTYTKYEATQHQRKLETTMRAQRERIALLKEGGADEQDIINARAQYRLTSAEYAKFSKAMDIPQQRERVYVDGLGNVGVGKITPAQDIPKIQPRGLGAKASSKVTPAEREQLLRVPEGTKPQYVPELDFMSNSIRLKYSDDVTDIKVGSQEIPTYKVNKSQFNLYAETSEKPKSKAVRLCERNLRAIQNELPDDFVMPDVIVVDFHKYGYDKILDAEGNVVGYRDAIGGHDPKSGKLIFNSKYNSYKKILEYVNREPGRFANKTIYAPYLHELGHKYYEDCVKSLAFSENIEYNKAKSIINHRLYDYITENNLSDQIEIKISKYAFDKFEKDDFSDLIAECFSVKGSNGLADDILKLLKG